MPFSSFRQVIVLITYVVMVATGIMATLLPLNGQTTAEILSKYTTYFTPEEYVFVIWGVIYLLLGGFVIYQGLSSQKNNKKIVHASVLLSFSSMVNSVWIFAWHFELLEISLVLMVVLLVLLIAMYQALSGGEHEKSRITRLFIYAPISVYLGWISVMTVVNALVVVSFYEWTIFGLSLQSLAAIMIGIVTILTFIVLVVKSDWIYAGVIVWAFIGLRQAFLEIPLLSITALVASVLIVIFAFVASQSRGRVTPSKTS